MISQVTVTVWHVKNHLVILVVTDETAADSVSELCVIVHKVADSADAWKRKQMKWSHVNWHQEVMKNQSTDISAHEKDSAAAQRTADNVRLSAHDNQHWADLHQKAVHAWLQEENWEDKEEKKEWEDRDREFDRNVRLTWAQHQMRRDHESTVIQNAE